MLYRALIVAIVLFWMGMMGTLVRTEWFPQEAKALTVPTDYLWKLAFLHEEASDLVVYNGHERLGNLHLQPHRQPGGGTDGQGARSLTVVGGFNTNLSWLGQANVVLHGTLQMDSNNEARQVRLATVLHTPGQGKNDLAFSVDGSALTRQWHYVVQRNGETVSEDTGTLEHLLDRPEVRSWGIDPRAMLRSQQEGLGRVSIVARHGKLRVNKDEIDTFVVTIKDANGLESTIHVNQLGQLLAVRTFTGISLLDGTLNP